MFWRALSKIVEVAIILTAAVLAALAVSMVRAAPAPLPRYERAIIHPLPVDCVMHWTGTAYSTEFSRDGSYRARCGDYLRYTGWWALAGRLLIIREVLVGGTEWREYHIDLDACLRRGVIRDGGEWSITPPPEPEIAPLPVEVN
jgi:hypothetical protein